MSLHPGGAQSRWPFDGGGRAMGAGALVPTTVAICPLVDLGFRLHTFTRDSPRRCLTHCQPRCSRDRMLSGTFSAFETRLKSASAHCDFRESQRPDGSAGGALGLRVLLGLPHPSRSLPRVGVATSLEIGGSREHRVLCGTVSAVGSTAPLCSTSSCSRGSHTAGSPGESVSACRSGP